MKQKRTYEQPRTDVVELRVTNQLLAGSNTLEDYNWNTSNESRFFDAEETPLYY